MSRRVIVVTGSKGGSGATTLAFEIVKRLGSSSARAVLVDGDLAGRRSHAVTYDVIRQLDENRSPSSPALAPASDCDLFEITNSYEEGFAVKGAVVEEFICKLPADSTFIADLPQPFAAAVRPLVTRALRFVVVVEPTLLGVSSARQLLLGMARFGIPPGRIVIVLNSRDGTFDLKRGEIQATLQVSVIAELPQRRDRGYGRAVQSLVETLLKFPHLEPLPDLRPSASIPTGDRRLASRTNAGPMAASGAPAGTRRLEAVAADIHLPAVVDSHAAANHDIIKNQIHESLMSRIDFGAAARMFTDVAKMAELRAQVNDLASELIAARKDIDSVEVGARIKQEIVQEALGLGPIESLMHDPSVTEIMVNGSKEVYVERLGKIGLAPNRFVDDRQVRLVIERILAPLGRRIDESSPMVDARLLDGSRVNATIPPLSIDGPTLTIRRFGTTRLSFADLRAAGALTGGIVEFLRASVEARLNIVVSGGTGSGKTTLLNAMSSFIPRTDRIITIEDAAELLLNQPHVIRLESRPPNLEGTGEIRIRECVKNALRMRPDRIVVGECRGGEALDMLQAMNTGHDGSLTTVHANTPRDALARIETMVMMAGFELPVRAIREQVSAAIDIVVQISRFSDGSRKLTSISEVVGMEGDVVTMQELVRYKQRGIDANRVVVGAFEASGVQPMCLRRFGELGIDFDPAAFGPAPGSTVAAWSGR
jgi:pilus assembly protein CpaF